MSIFLQKTVFTRTLMRRHSCAAADGLHILLMASMGLNRCAMWAHLIAVACRVRYSCFSGVLTFYAAYACQLSQHLDSGIAAAIPAYSVLLPAAASVGTGVFSAGDQAVRKRVRADSAKAVHCSPCCCA